MKITMTAYKEVPANIWRGKKVRLLQDVTTNGGTTYPAGTVAQIVGKFKGFALRSDPCAHCGVRLIMAKVPPNWLETVE